MIAITDPGRYLIRYCPRAGYCARLAAGEIRDPVAANPGACGPNSPDPSSISTPSLRSDFTLCLYGARAARAELTKGRTTTGILKAAASARMPSASASLMPDGESGPLVRYLLAQRRGRGRGCAR